MFRSIRWRLVLSYVLLTVLTVSLVGLLTLSLVKQFVEQRVVEDLMANAESVAQQAESLMWPTKQPFALRELARTAAFLGGVRVRILDERYRLLVDSGSSTGVDRLMWLKPPVEFDLGPFDQSWIMVVPSGQLPEIPIPQGIPFFEQLPADVQWTLVNRIAGAWGNRFTFEGVGEGERSLSFLKGVGIGSSQEPTGAEEKIARSEPLISAIVGDTENPLGYVELSGGPDFGAEALATIRRAFSLAAGGVLFLAIVVGLLVSHGLTAPLRGLTATASRMGEDLSTRASVQGQDEIGQLARQLNSMAERLEASFAALTADRDALRRFIADASHELRTPITALRNFNELLQGVASDDPDAHEEFLAESAVQLHRLEWITNNLLDLSRLDTGLIALDLERHDVGEMIEAVGAVFKTMAQEKEIAFSISQPSASIRLLCDRARVELALSNLLGNALKFTPSGGRVEMGAEKEGARVRMWVRDNGPGIDPVDRPHIFERFYRGRENRAEGSGLGLAIVQSVVQAHGGRVWVESDLAAGSCFVIELPQEGRG